MDTPLDPLGRVQKIWRDGSVLMAKLLFPADMAGFLRRRGVQKLWVGLSREAVGLALAEVSLVLKPRVAAAAMFGRNLPPAVPADPSLGRWGEIGERIHPPENPQYTSGGVGQRPGDWAAAGGTDGAGGLTRRSGR